MLIDFLSPWCGSFKMIAPIIDELVKQYDGKIMYFHPNTDKSPNISTKYGMQRISTIMIFKSGENKEYLDYR